MSAINSGAERLLLVATPMVAMAAVALGLRLGAPGVVRAAVVYGATPAAAGTGLAWQIASFRQDHGERQPTGGVAIEVLARAGGDSARWRGTTNADGVAEALLPWSHATAVWLSVRAGDVVLAQGTANPPPTAEPMATRTSEPSGFLPFARREGAVALDVALLGSGAAPGFPVDLWVRATSRTTGAPVAGASVDLDPDSTGARSTVGALTDARGWADLSVTPVGLAVTMTLRSKSADGASGQWIGGLPMSPGAAKIETRLRWGPDDEPEIDVTAPTARATAYVEIDDSRGRAWAATPSLSPRPDGTSQVGVRVPRLAPGLYWAVASSAPSFASGLGSGSIARPFFVAASDAAALALGGRREGCALPRDVREIARAEAACLALSTQTPVSRWIALDGLEAQGAHDRALRERGLRVALGAILVSVLLEATLLLRTAARSHVRFAVEATDGAADRPVTISAAVLRWGSVAVVLLVALLGFALLAAFLVRVA